MVRIAAAFGIVIVSITTLIAPAVPNGHLPEIPAWVTDLAVAACRSERLSEQDLAAKVAEAGSIVADAERLAAHDAASGLRFMLTSGADVQVTIRLPGTANQRTRVVYTPPPARRGTDLFVQAAPGCGIDLARMVERDDVGRPERLIGYEGDLRKPSSIEELNPPVPPGADPGGVAVATIDTGIAYTLPQFAGRLARDSDGRILGHDFHDDDDRPFDLDPSRPAVFPIRHGTAVASILLREAPDIRLVPLRYPAGAPEKFAAMVEHIAAGPARIVSMPLGGARRDEWEPFAAAARRHPGILFVVSAGNDGRDIDANPIYPAGFGLDNVLVVTSTDAFGRLAAESNWGARTVDIAVPGERIDVVDHRGAAGKASGSSYAVPRVAALAARMMARDPGLDAAAIKSAILGLAVPLGEASRPVAAGWIPNPAIE
jgi:subtilisin family serine protease